MTKIFKVVETINFEHTEMILSSSEFIYTANHFVINQKILQVLNSITELEIVDQLVMEGVANPWKGFVKICDYLWPPRSIRANCDTKYHTTDTSPSYPSTSSSMSNSGQPPPPPYSKPPPPPMGQITYTSASAPPLPDYEQEYIEPVPRNLPGLIDEILRFLFV